LPARSALKRIKPVRCRPERRLPSRVATWTRLGRRGHRACGESLIAAAARRPLGVRTRSGRDDPGGKTFCCRHYLGTIDETAAAHRRYLRATQAITTGPRFMAAARHQRLVKAYFALRRSVIRSMRRICDVPRAAILAVRRARATSHAHCPRLVWVRCRGARSRSAVEIMLLPRWFPFHVDKISYWSRHRTDPAISPDGGAPTGAEPARNFDRRNVHRPPENRDRLDFAVDPFRRRHAFALIEAWPPPRCPGRPARRRASKRPSSVVTSGSTARTVSAAFSGHGERP